MKKQSSLMPPDYHLLGYLGEKRIMIRIDVVQPTLHIGNDNSQLGESHKIFPHLTGLVKITNPTMLAVAIVRTKITDISNWKIQLDQAGKNEILQKLMELKYQKEIKFPK